MIKKILTTIKGLWNKLTDPTRGLQIEYGRLLLEARNLQRRGDIPSYARKIKEAEEIRKKIEEITSIRGINE